ncbi:MAG TPA: nucleoside triphosphate pyrophosphohydrolase family protein [Anaerolineales bacterium]|nr:nucleoside triphosphate pyrophosphohydrolase family protein [Anaerolineales bacterium]HRF46234.1 nucleoside triphosphate pyrophosphohydrolase family protein [Anaerolineales bacterium]
MRAQIQAVDEFHIAFGAYRNDAPAGAIPPEVQALRVRLIAEELDEYRRAAEAGDLVGVADALSDLAYVLFGTYVAHGLKDQAEALFAEVHASNMSKLDVDSKPVLRADGKVLKSALFRPPDLQAVLSR